MARELSRLVFGTATPGGGFPAYGWPYAEVLNAADATLGIEPINTKGSTENRVLLEQNKIDLGLVTSEVTYEAIKGIGGPAAWAGRCSRKSPADQMVLEARALHRSEAAFARRLEQTAESTLANNLAAAPSRDLIHPGVLLYMREAGLLQAQGRTSR